MSIDSPPSLPPGRPPNHHRVYKALLDEMRLHVPDLVAEEGDYGWSFYAASRTAHKVLWLERTLSDGPGRYRHVSLRTMFVNPDDTPRTGRIALFARELARAFDKAAQEFQ